MLMVLAGFSYFLGTLFSIFSVSLVGLLVYSYYADYKKNKKYYTESFVFWAILILGAAVLHLIFTVFLHKPLWAWALCAIWFSWVVVRLNNTGDKKD
jgi:uncharacterized membrane protein YoaK (UPF0700 family)